MEDRRSKHQQHMTVAIVMSILTPSFFLNGKHSETTNTQFTEMGHSRMTLKNFIDNMSISICFMWNF